ncbi:heme lyase CcmF/NrfE family subunit [Ferrovum sp.]|jgi:cytochrome c-type biogenesis protein CcmF|uniref:heme lyase CcmF/NrfE family subunit n=1 Tax=Ferrovum sp. TaxID=2609467 RepID=UPI0026115FC6|nr:heme lyase CcmF/NrfE family subunit [Ferrovum sp.]MBW8067850.1 heme lyase CcmF/NrfE family subunit [Ferrovum sp.]
MAPELGHYSLILALTLAMGMATFSLVGAQRGVASWIGLSRPLALTLLLAMAVSFGCLAWSFVHNDFSVLYVVQHSNSKLPVQYQFSAVWGGHEGSLLLWVLLLSTWSAAVALFSRRLPDPVVARALGVLGLVITGFLLFILLTSNPFDRLFPAALEGRDLNPLLQDPGLVYHPPMLYMGYVGFSVAFAFALSALISGKLDATWARWSRPWTLAAWVFLTLGICFGSRWAYYELGWGGWWFWDPVENASFMPWLVGTALIHSLVVTEKRGAFKRWTVLLAIAAFSLSLVGTFIVRSGVLNSVHAFASDPKRGIFVLLFLSLVIGGSLTLFAWRAPAVGEGGRFQLVSRESFLLLNNVLLAVAAAAVLLGTIYPMVIDALGMGKLSVGPPYFNTVFVPLMIPLLLILPIGTLAHWKRANLKDILREVRPDMVIALVVGIVVPFLMGAFSLLSALGIATAAWLATSIVRQVWSWRRLKTIPRWFIGMQTAHFGMAVFVVGVTLIKGYEIERDVRMGPGDTLTLKGTTFRLVGVEPVPGPNYSALRGAVTYSENGKVEGLLEPEKRTYFSSPMPMTEAAIHSTISRDLYVSLGEPLDNGAWSVRIYYKPFVNWIWAGCVLMALGGAVAASDRRYRVQIKTAAQQERAVPHEVTV